MKCLFLYEGLKWLRVKHTGNFLIFLVLLLLILPSSLHGLKTTPPVRTDNNTIIASYNIKWMGSTPHDLSKLADVIQHFDICGILEIKSEDALEELVLELEKQSGKDWGFVYNIRTHRPNGSYHEVYGCVWRKDRVSIGDGLVTSVWDRYEQFRNDPFLVSFVAGEQDFLLMFVHTRWSNDADGSRKGEVEEIVKQIEYLGSYLEEDQLFLAGDFNYSNEHSEMEKMAVDAELFAVDVNDKTTFKRDYSDYASPYDHVYASEAAVDLLLQQAEALDATTLIYGDRSKSSMKKSKRELSDHLPVFFIINR